MFSRDRAYCLRLSQTPCIDEVQSEALKLQNVQINKITCAPDFDTGILEN